MKTIKKVIATLFILLLMGLAWHLALTKESHYRFVIPSPLDTLQAIYQNSARLFFHCKITFFEMVAGLLLAISASFVLAWVMYQVRFLSTLLQPLFIFIQCLPMFTLAPIMVIWLGWSFFAIVIPVALMIFFPLTLSIYKGLQSTSQDLIDFFKSVGATPLQLYFKLYLPSAQPHIFSGLRIASGIAGIGAVAGEWAGGQAGLGMLMLESRKNIDLEITFSALLLLTLMSFCFYMAALALEKIITHRR